MKSVKCPQCGKSNHVTRSTCFDCGSSLTNATGDVSAPTVYNVSTGKAFAVGAIIGATILILQNLFLMIEESKDRDGEWLFYVFYLPFCLILGILIGGFSAIILGWLGAEFREDYFWKFAIVGSFLGPAIFVLFIFSIS